MDFRKRNSNISVKFEGTIFIFAARTIFITKLYIREQTDILRSTESLVLMKFSLRSGTS